MGRKLEQRNTRSLTKTAGHSLGITLPIEFIRKLGWRARQKLTITPKGKELKTLLAGRGLEFIFASFLNIFLLKPCSDI